MIGVIVVVFAVLNTLTKMAFNQGMHTTVLIPLHYIASIVCIHHVRPSTGSVALLAGAACWSFWFILQSRLGKKYPALYSGNALMFLLSFLHMAAVGLATERDLSVWILRTKLQIITVLFVRGPVFTTAFTPLIQLIAGAINIVALHEQLHVGSALGSALVIAGLYFVLWAKTKEASDSDAAQSSNVPLPEQKSKQATQQPEDVCDNHA
uniref:WAT1-related protein n=1 Tax=Setaria viridis TaxID=4556 RepID=A0A4U6W7M0_SETVI|nr:hypothetical protein SEVIR_1G115200v2 [Setaria viridis]